MKVLITMAGLGSRFQKIGIKIPKYKIIAHDKSLFEWSMYSLKDFYYDPFVFLIRRDIVDKNFICKVCLKLGISNFKIIPLDSETDGQATTALYANSQFIDERDSLIIYNIDTYVKPMAIKKSDILTEYDGFIPVFTADGNKWSFISVNGKKVIDITEKKPISKLATVGFYYFKHWIDFKEIYHRTHKSIKEEYREAYVAPMYQEIIKNNGYVGFKIIDSEDVIPLGTPEDVIAFDNLFFSKNK